MKDMKKSKKLTIAITAVAVLAIALVGVAYAIDYYGTTQNSGNTVKSAYIKVGQDTYADNFDKKVLYNTVTTSNNANGTTYTLKDDQDGYAATRGNLEGGAEDKITTPTVLLGSVELTVTQTQNPNGSYDAFVLDVKHDADITGTYKIGIKIGAAAEKFYDLSASSNSGYTTASIAGAASTTIVVNIYLSVSTEGTTSAPTATPVDNVTFTFKATATAA